MATQFYKSILFISLASLIVFLSGCENRMGTQRGAASGLVVDNNGYGVSNAIITSHRSLFKAQTDENGKFKLTSLDVGSHRLAVERDGYFVASKTIEIDYGQVITGIKIVTQAFDNNISFNIINREKETVTIDINCAEPMSVWAAYREINNARIQTEPTELGTNHQIVLENLWAGSEYILSIEGITKDSRRFVSKTDRFTTVHPLDLPGDPDVPDSFAIKQSATGPLLSWQYNGADPVKGFRIYRGVNGSKLQMIRDENQIIAQATSFEDDSAMAANLYTYAIKAVDLDNNTSEFTEYLQIMAAGTLSADTIWHKDLSPISLQGDINIPQGLTLTINPGVTVRISDTDKSRRGYAPLKCEFIVQGKLIAQGTETEPIRFISASSSPTRKDWVGIRILGEQSKLEHVLVTGAENGIANYSSSTLIKNAKFRYCHTGLSLHTTNSMNINKITAVECEVGISLENTTDTILDDFKILSCSTGVLMRNNSDAIVRNFDIRNAFQTGISVVDRVNSRLRNGIIQSQATGILAGGADADYQFITIDAVDGIIVESNQQTIVRNNILVNIQYPLIGTGIEDMYTQRSYPYNNIYNFLDATVNCNQLGAPVLNVDPQFVGGDYETFDYRLKSSSPLLTASDRNGQIGAYGTSL